VAEASVDDSFFIVTGHRKEGQRAHLVRQEHEARSGPQRRLRAGVHSGSHRRGHGGAHEQEEERRRCGGAERIQTGLIDSLSLSLALLRSHLHSVRPSATLGDCCNVTTDTY
jgi:hypothetical protein